MKTLTVFFIIIGFLTYNSYTFAVLTVEDLEKIREIVDKSDARVEKNLKEHVTKTKEHLSDVLAAQGKRLDYLGTVMIALIVSIIGFVSVPMGLITYISVSQIPFSAG